LRGARFSYESCGDLNSSDHYELKFTFCVQASPSPNLGERGLGGEGVRTLENGSRLSPNDTRQELRMAGSQLQFRFWRMALYGMFTVVQQRVRRVALLIERCFASKNSPPHPLTPRPPLPQDGRGGDHCAERDSASRVVAISTVPITMNPRIVAIPTCNPTSLDRIT
jgi:hypothetical protein